MLPKKTDSFASDPTTKPSKQEPTSEEEDNEEYLVFGQKKVADKELFSDDEKSEISDFDEFEAKIEENMKKQHYNQTWTPTAT